MINESESTMWALTVVYLELIKLLSFVRDYYKNVIPVLTDRNIEVFSYVKVSAKV